MRLWEFREHQVAMAKRAEAAAMMYALVRRYQTVRVSAELERAGRLEGPSGQDPRLLRKPLVGLLGEGAVALEYSRGKVEAADELKAAIESIRVSLD